MVLRSPLWNPALFAQIQPGKPQCRRLKSSVTGAATGAVRGAEKPSSGKSRPFFDSITPQAAAKRDYTGQSSPPGRKPVDLTSLYTSITQTEKQKKSQERDFLVSVLSSSVTKRDAKKYLQTFGGDKTAEALALTGKLSRRTLPSSAGASSSGPAYNPPGDSIRAVSQSPQFVQGPREDKAPRLDGNQKPHVAIIKLQDPDTIDEGTLAELAKTFVQLRQLGLIGVVVVGLSSTVSLPLSTSASAPTLPAPLTSASPAQIGWFDDATHQMARIATAVDKYSSRATSIVDSAVIVDERRRKTDELYRPEGSPFVPGRVCIDSSEALMRPLRNGNIVVIPSFGFSANGCKATPIPTDDIVLALTRFFSGIQSGFGGASAHAGFEGASAHAGFEGAESAHAGAKALPENPASVDRIIIIDPVGGTPSERRPNGAHVFLNMEEEYVTAKQALDTLSLQPPPHLLDNRVLGKEGALKVTRDRHKANLDIARNALAILPSSSSALLTTAAEAANLVSPSANFAAANAGNGGTSGVGDGDVAATDADVFGFVGSVGTRRSQNPLIHNLLTDRPVYSSSLPLGRVKPSTKRLARGLAGEAEAPRLPKTTLAKRGMPLTIFPDPRHSPWTPPTPGGPRLRLSDTCIDLPRLVHLIDDSFNRQLDVADYLARVQDSLAGVIIAGEYEGGAILTWERPFGLDEETAYRTGRLVPYLDKFAVLKKSQGAGGVADIVFTAMVRDCFPDGVCWRSRKDNPVNRWYFERSRGCWKLADVNWTMFWTTPWEGVGGEQGLWDYENVCRSVEPSWADQKHILD